jgi:hypothetical protein
MLQGLLIQNKIVFEEIIIAKATLMFFTRYVAGRRRKTFYLKIFHTFTYLVLYQ